MFTTDPHAAAVLQRLLSAQLLLPPEYAQGLSSHLPMGLQALSALGADAARLEAFFGQYVQHFERARPAPPAQPLAGAWQDGYGRIEHWATLRLHFSQRLASEGRDAVLTAVLPRLWEGMAAAAFHGPIRVAHAVQAEHEGELAAALAYWAARWQPLSPPGGASPALPLQAWAEALTAQGRGWRSAAGLISLRMDEAVASAPYQALAAALLPTPSLRSRLRQLAGLALPAYAASRDFTLLHAVTGLQALEVLLSWLDDRDLALQAALDRAFVAAWLSATRRDARPAPAPLQDWPALRTQALASDDEHVIKLVQACAAQAGAWGERACREAASAAVAG